MTNEMTPSIKDMQNLVCQLKHAPGTPQRCNGYGFPEANNPARAGSPATFSSSHRSDQAMPDGPQDDATTAPNGSQTAS